MRWSGSERIWKGGRGETKEIELVNKKGVALVDDEDHPMLSQYRWCLQKSPNDIVGYAKTRDKGRIVYMHRMLFPEAARVDHRDGNSLNNQRYNLRDVTHAQNMMNQRPQHGKRFKGTRKCGTKWGARIFVNKRLLHLGYFTTEEEGARAYDQAAREHFGEFAWLNFPDVPRKEMGRAEVAAVSTAEVA